MINYQGDTAMETNRTPFGKNRSDINQCMLYVIVHTTYSLPFKQQLLRRFK